MALYDNVFKIQVDNDASMVSVDSPSLNKKTENEKAKELFFSEITKMRTKIKQDMKMQNKSAKRKQESCKRKIEMKLEQESPESSKRKIEISHIMSEMDKFTLNEDLFSS